MQARYLAVWLNLTNEKKKKYFPKKTEKRKKEKESNFTGRDADRPKGNGISPEGWQGKHNHSAKPPYLPCHYAVVFWLGGAVAVRLIFAPFFILFLINSNQRKGTKNT